MKASVLLTTYNHENWIAQAIDSTLMQETNFDYEVVIMEDRSTDHTRDIVLDFQRRYPDRIRSILSEKNKCDNTNFIAAWQSSPSQYIAWLDGDDYWTSSHKLQRQVDSLDAHPECAICFHNVMHLYEDGSQVPYDQVYGKPKEISTLDDLWAGNFMQTCSVMLRKGSIGEFPAWFDTEWSADWALYILAAQHGNIGYIDELMGVYRIHDRGFWSKHNEIRKLEEIIKFYKNINANLGFRYKETIDLWVCRWYEVLAREKAKELEERLSKRRGKDSKVWNALQKAVQSGHTNAPVEFIDVSSWNPDPEQGRWLAWQLQIFNRQLQILNRKLQNRERRLRRNRDISERNRRLAQQLENIEGSTAWKLWKKLNYLRARVLGR